MKNHAKSSHVVGFPSISTRFQQDSKAFLSADTSRFRISRQLVHVLLQQPSVHVPHAEALVPAAAHQPWVVGGAHG